MCFSSCCGFLSFIFSKPVCAGWWDYNSYGSYWAVSTALVINNPKNSFHICIIPRAFFAADSKKKWNLGPLKSTSTSYIWLRTGDRHVWLLIMTEAVELNVAWKLVLVGAAQGPSALSGVCELAKTSGVRKLVCCLSFLSWHFSIGVLGSWIPHLHTWSAFTV